MQVSNTILKLDQWSHSKGRLINSALNGVHCLKSSLRKDWDHSYLYLISNTDDRVEIEPPHHHQKKKKKNLMTSSAL